MTKDEMDADISMITGMFLISSIPAIVLLDSGATHSFISDKLYGNWALLRVQQRHTLRLHSLREQSYNKQI